MNDQLENAFNSLPDNDPIKKALIRAIQNIKEDFQAGEYIPKNKISGSSEIGILSVVLDWMNHKDYQRLFEF